MEYIFLILGVFAMKITEGFLLRKVANQSVVMPMGKKAFDFNRAITLNETAAFLWAVPIQGTCFRLSSRFRACRS